MQLLSKLCSTSKFGAMWHLGTCIYWIDSCFIWWFIYFSRIFNLTFVNIIILLREILSLEMTGKSHQSAFKGIIKWAPPRKRARRAFFERTDAWKSHTNIGSLHAPRPDGVWERGCVILTSVCFCYTLKHFVNNHTSIFENMFFILNNEFMTINNM